MQRRREGAKGQGGESIGFDTKSNTIKKKRHNSIVCSLWSDLHLPLRLEAKEKSMQTGLHI